jgi:hypothetical protein
VVACPKPSWSVFHASEVGLDCQPDARVFRWAQERRAVIITFDEDSGDIRSGRGLGWQ